MTSLPDLKCSFSICCLVFFKEHTWEDTDKDFVSVFRLNTSPSSYPNTHMDNEVQLNF